MASTPTKEATHVLIRTWIELPPKWDVVPTSDIIGKIQPGETCNVKYDHIRTPHATILMLGSESMLKEELKKIENEEEEVEHDPSIKQKRKEEFDSNGCQLEEKILSLQVKMAYLEKQMKMKDVYLEKEIELKFKYLKKEIELLGETKEKVTATDVPAAVRELRFLDHHFSASQIHDEHSPTANVSSSGMKSSPTNLSSPPAAIDFQAAELLRQQDSMVKIGPNTKITLAQYNALDWTKGTQAVRDLCQAVFGREILRTHNLTGRFRGVSSNVQETKPPKPMLDPAKVADIIELASQMTNLSPSEVRRAITNKCKGTPNERITRSKAMKSPI